MARRKSKLIPMTCLLAIFILTLVLPVNLFAEEYEVPGDISASSLFSKNLLKGPDHKIMEKGVTYNGFTNTFSLRSRFGNMKAVGNGMVAVRVQEIRAIAHLAEIKGSSAFVDGMKESGGSMVTTTKNLIVHPVDTVSGIPSGLSNIFGSLGVVAGQTVKGETSVGQALGAGGKAITGFTRNKRELAYSLGVNVYSDNKVLQENLNSVSWATTGGSLTVDMAKMVPTGGAGAVLTGLSLTRATNRMVRDNSTPGLHRLNQDALQDAGIEESAINRFLANKKLTPSHQTRITHSIISLARPNNLGVFLNHVAEHAITTADANMYQAVAAMIAGYNRHKTPITKIGSHDNVIIFKNAEGSYVLTYPADNFFWTKRIANKVKGVVSAIPSGAKKELWISGRFSDLSA
ncbi:MAG: hypothetical protein V3U73_01170, partial [bacterium]